MASRPQRLAAALASYARIAWWGLVAPRTPFERRRLVIVQAVVLREAAAGAASPRVLLAVRSDLMGWELPGGTVEPGEALEDAVIREVREETGIEVAVERLIDHVNIIQHDDDGRVRVHYLLLDFLARPIGGRLQAGTDAADAKWVPLSDIPALKLWTETETMIARGAAMLATVRG